MGWMSLRSWLKASLPALGGLGLLAASFVDSSFVPLPLVTDLLLIDLSSRHPMRMPYYAGMAAVGSLAGCLWIYYLARKG
jgi:membrane protein YqaA with SNARE-associated domain